MVSSVEPNFGPCSGLTAVMLGFVNRNVTGFWEGVEVAEPVVFTVTITGTAPVVLDASTVQETRFPVNVKYKRT